MTEILKLKITNRNFPEKFKLNLNILRRTYFRNKTHKLCGSKIYNTLPHEIKSAESLNIFKKMITDCNCIACRQVKNIIIIYKLKENVDQRKINLRPYCHHHHKPLSQVFLKKLSSCHSRSQDFSNLTLLLLPLSKL